MRESQSRITDSNQESPSVQLASTSSPAGAEEKGAATEPGESCSKRRIGLIQIETHEHNYTRLEGSDSGQLVCDYVHGDGRVCGESMSIGLSVAPAFGTYAYEVRP